MNYLGLKEQEVIQLEGELNDLLSCYHIYYQNLRCHHWFVQGSNFFDLHKKFEEMYNEAKSNIDEIAERLLTLSLSPVGRLSEYLSRSKVKEVEQHLSDEDMVKRILLDHSILIDCMRKALSSASDADDEGTVDMVAGMLRNIEKSSWMLNMWLKQEAITTTVSI
jgi:starvation-inducible DNA-binding protein